MKMQCRLCSSTLSLISLFKGKCRSIRAYIRKLIDVTIGLKVDDPFTFICYPCTIQVYNFYIFRNSSIENDKILREHNHVENLSENEASEADNVVLPDVNELKLKLVPWLVSKQKYCTDPICEPNLENGNELVDITSTTPSKSLVVENATQCDQSKLSDRDTQYELFSSGKYTQTDIAARSSKKTQCNLLNKQKRNVCTTQTEVVNETTLVDQSTQCDNNHIKQEVKSLGSLSPPMLSPINCLHINDDTSSKDDTVTAPVIDYMSPRASRSPSLLAVIQKRTRSVIICPNCDKTLYSKSQYLAHRKSHMVCNFCKKKFRSIKQTRLHMEQDCKVTKLTKTEPIITLMRLENLKDVRRRYPECFDRLERLCERKNMDIKCNIPKVFRIRSKSVSSVDSFSCDCKSCFSFLQKLCNGVDKCVQTNLLFDTEFIKTDYTILKTSVKEEANGNVPAKRIKLT